MLDLVSRTFRTGRPSGPPHGRAPDGRATERWRTPRNSHASERHRQQLRTRGISRTQTGRQLRL
eukprot:2157130-Pleurochrysis_carterae.AAC.1